MRLELAKLHAELGTTMIYVTHDQTEAMTLADKIVVLDKGRDFAGRLAARALQRAGQQVRRRLHRFAEHEFLSRRDRRRRTAVRRTLSLPGGRSAAVRSCQRASRGRRRELGVRPEHLAHRRSRRPSGRLRRGGRDRRTSRQLDDPLCRYARWAADRRGRGRPRREGRRRASASGIDERHARLFGETGSALCDDLRRHGDAADAVNPRSSSRSTMS